MSNALTTLTRTLATKLDMGDGADLIVKCKADGCANPNFRKCPFCKEYDSPERMKHNPSSRYYYHAACKQEYRKARSAQA